MASTAYGRVCVAVLQDTPPTELEWRSWLALLCAHKGSQLRVLVETHSGPTAAQRKALADAFRGEDVRFAIVTDSLVVRGIVTALSWLGVPHHAFAPEQRGQACNYLDLDPSEREQLETELSRLHYQLEPH